MKLVFPVEYCPSRRTIGAASRSVKHAEWNLSKEKASSSGWILLW